MNVGDKVLLKEFPSWGMCEITKVHVRGTEETYTVERCASKGITLLCHVTADRLTVVDQDNENR